MTREELLYRLDLLRRDSRNIVKYRGHQSPAMLAEEIRLLYIAVGKEPIEEEVRTVLK